MVGNSSLLVEGAAALAEAETRTQSAGPRMRWIPVVSQLRIRKQYHPRWTKPEEEYVRCHLGRKPVREIARALGRTETAVNLRWKRELHLPAPRCHPEWFTLEQIAVGVGKDQHSIVALVDRGILPARRLPPVTRSRTAKNVGWIRVVDRRELLAWLLDPMHWVYIDPQRVGEFKHRSWRRDGRPDVVFWRDAREKVLQAKAAWKDAWMRTGDAQALILPNGKDKFRGSLLNNALHAGLVKGVKWSNWFFLRSEVLRFARESIVIKDGWKVPRISYKPPLPKDFWKQVATKRLKSRFYLERARRNRIRDRAILRVRKAGKDFEYIGRKFHMTGGNVRRICAEASHEKD